MCDGRGCCSWRRRHPRGTGQTAATPASRTAGQPPARPTESAVELPVRHPTCLHGLERHARRRRSTERLVDLAPAGGSPTEESGTAAGCDSVYDIGSITEAVHRGGRAGGPADAGAAPGDRRDRRAPPRTYRRTSVGSPYDQLLTHTSGLVDVLGGDYDQVSRSEIEGRPSPSASEAGDPNPARRTSTPTSATAFLAAIVEEASGIGTTRSTWPGSLFDPRLGDADRLCAAGVGEVRPGRRVRRRRRPLTGPARTSIPGQPTGRTGTCVATAACSRRHATCSAGTSRSRTTRSSTVPPRRRSSNPRVQ